MGEIGLEAAGPSHKKKLSRPKKPTGRNDLVRRVRPPFRPPSRRLNASATTRTEFPAVSAVLAVRTVVLGTVMCNSPPVSYPNPAIRRHFRRDEGQN